jgi:hypothetical protein
MRSGAGGAAIGTCRCRTTVCVIKESGNREMRDKASSDRYRNFAPVTLFAR